MASVVQVMFLKPRPGGLEVLMRNVGRAKKIVERCGGRMRVWNQLAGGNPGAIAAVIEATDWKTFGEYSARLEGDSEFQAFMNEINSSRDPEADVIRTLMHVEVPS